MQNLPNNASRTSSVEVRPTSASKALRARRKFSAISSGSLSDFAAERLCAASSNRSRCRAFKAATPGLGIADRAVSIKAPRKIPIPSPVYAETAKSGASFLAASARSIWAAMSQLPSGPSPSSPNQRTRSAFAISSLALEIPMVSIASSLSSRSPAMSANVNGIPAIAMDRVSTSRVVPAMSAVIAASLSTRTLNKVDFPAFGGPANANSKPFPQRLGMWRIHAITQSGFKVSQGLGKTLRQATHVILIVEIENSLDLCGQTQQFFPPAFHFSRQGTACHCQCTAALKFGFG